MSYDQCSKHHTKTVIESETTRWHQRVVAVKVIMRSRISMYIVPNMIFFFFYQYTYTLIGLGARNYGTRMNGLEIGISVRKNMACDLELNDNLGLQVERETDFCNRARGWSFKTHQVAHHLLYLSTFNGMWTFLSVFYTLIESYCWKRKLLN